MFKNSYKSLESLVPTELTHAPKYLKVEVANAIVDALELALTSKINSDPIFAQKLQEIRLLKRKANIL